MDILLLVFIVIFSAVLIALGGMVTLLIVHYRRHVADVSRMERIVAEHQASLRDVQAVHNSQAAELLKMRDTMGMLEYQILGKANVKPYKTSQI